ncbi:MAG TPA: dihydrolipoamide acetyltransferase family protein [Hyphomicrobium sp.]|nr:dihydrolipoamide acetyltransferase family protein [Hyphomicrobium sp.]
MIAFRLPSLGADMDEGTLIEWLKKPGDVVKRGDVVAVVETQKGAMELEVFTDGVIENLLVKPGTRIPVGKAMATIRSADEPSGRDLESSGLEVAPRAPGATAKAADEAHAAPAPAAPQPHRPITPAARRRAEELGVDPDMLSPEPGGIVGLQEVEAAARKAKAPSSGIATDEMRRAIGAAMARSHREIPHYYVSSTINVSRMLDWLQDENSKRPVPARLLYAAPLVRAIALAVSKVPDLNGRFMDGQFEPSSAVNIGVAIALRKGGLIAPAILGVEGLGLDEIMQRLRDLVARVRGGRLRSSEMTEGTITLSNLGEDTADTILPLIYPPQTAIVGCGRIAERPWVCEGRVVAARAMTITVAGDHRVSDGRRAALFLNHLDALLQKPDSL